MQISVTATNSNISNVDTKPKRYTPRQRQHPKILSPCTNRLEVVTPGRFFVEGNTILCRLAPQAILGIVQSESV